MTAGLQEQRSTLLFTSPWDPVTVRRGDALGLRALAERFADGLAPDLTNRTHDARWITILSWCLERSHAIWAKAGRRGVSTRLDATQRYGWLRPLELLWIARTLVVARDDWKGRQLAGQRRVRRWIADEQRAPRFAMSRAQFGAYRQTGMYGAYRTLFRRLAGLTLAGDGWTPVDGGHGLASWVDGKLGNHRPQDFEDAIIKWSIWRGREEAWWLRTWPTFCEGSSEATLPRKRDDFAPLPEGERVDKLLFGDGPNGRRRALITSLLDGADAADHLQLCKHLVSGLRKQPDYDQLRSLPGFSRLADAGMQLMDEIASALQEEGGGLRVAVADLARRAAVKEACAELLEAARGWRSEAHPTLPKIETADALAASVCVTSAAEQIGRLLTHHELHGGGLRWFVLRDGHVVPRTLPAGERSSRYRFRLWSLLRLGAQCGRITEAPPALRDDAGSLVDDPATDEADEESQ